MKTGCFLRPIYEIKSPPARHFPLPTSAPPPKKNFDPFTPKYLLYDVIGNRKAGFLTLSESLFNNILLILFSFFHTYAILCKGEVKAAAQKLS